MAITLPGILAKITGSAAKDVLDGVGGLVTDCMQAKITREQLDGKIKEMMQAHSDNIVNQISAAYTSDIADINSARNMNSNIEMSDKPSWLAKNIPYLIATMIILMWGFVTSYLVLRMLNLIATDPKVDMVPVLGVYSGVTATATIILTFYFGSSANSQKHSDALTEIAKSNSQQ